RVTYPAEAGRVLALSPNGKLFAAAAEPAPRAPQSDVQVWDAEAGRALATLKGVASGSAVQFSPDGKLLASFHRGVKTAWKEVKRAVQHEVKGKIVTEELTEKVPVTVASGQVKVWEARTGRLIFTHDNASGVLAFSPDGALLASANLVPMPDARPPMPVFPEM